MRKLLTNLATAFCLFVFCGCSVFSGLASKKSQAEKNLTKSLSLSSVQPDTSSQIINSEALKRFMDGELLVMQGNYPMAILEFQEALEYDPSSTTILTSLADAYMRLGKFSQAQKQLEKVLTIEPKHQKSRELLGQKYLIHNQIPQAEEQYRLLNEYYPDEVEYQYVLAEIALRKGEDEKAQQLFWQIYQKNPNEEQGLFRAGEIARERKDFDFAFRVYQELIKIHPDEVNFLRIYSELAVIMKETDKAIEALKQLTLLTQQDPLILSRLAILYYDHGERNKADSILTELYKNGDRSALVLYYRGRIELEKESYDTAKVISQELIDSFPEEPLGYTNQALAYINLDKNLEAISVLLEAIKRFPKDYAVNFLLGNSYIMQENYLLAKQSLLTALEVVPDSRAVKHLLGTVYNHLEEWENSDKIYQDLLSSDANDHQALNNYGYTLAERGIRLDEALKMAQGAVDADSGNSAYLDTMGWVYYKLGQIEKALDYIKKSAEKGGSDAVVLEHMGDILMKLDQEKQAKEYYRKAYQIDQDNGELKKKLEQMGDVVE